MLQGITSKLGQSLVGNLVSLNEGITSSFRELNFAFKHWQ